VTLLYRCDGCGKIADYLSYSWSTVTIHHEIEVPTLEDDNRTEVFHFCLECRSNKKEWPSGAAE
jgi:hypothetical protein